MMALTLSLIFVLASADVHAADICRAVFAKSAKEDDLELRIVMDVPEATRLAKSRSLVELTDLRPLLRKAYEAELGLQQYSHFSPMRLLAQNKARAYREVADRVLANARARLQRIIRLGEDHNLFIQITAETVQALDLDNPFDPVVEVTRGAELNSNDPEIGRQFVIKKATDALSGLDRTEKYFAFPKTLTAEQNAKFHSLAESIANPDKIQFFSNGRELNVVQGSFQLGKSYPVVINDGKLIIGDNYLNERGTTATTHLMLLRDAKGDQRAPVNYVGNAGAIRFNLDGGIDISGYHMKRKSLNAAAKIAEILETLIPAETPLRITAGRLTDLD